MTDFLLFLMILQISIAAFWLGDKLYCMIDELVKVRELLEECMSEEEEEL